MSDDVPEIRMRDRCRTCAYRAGTPAARSKLNQHKACACLTAMVPFLCHEADREALCAGWADAIEGKYRRGEQTVEWKRQVSLVILDAIEAAENGGEPDLPEMIRARMREMDDLPTTA